MRRFEGGAGVNAEDDLLDDPGRGDVLDQLAVGYGRVQGRQGVERNDVAGQHVAPFVPLRQRPRPFGQKAEGQRGQMGQPFGGAVVVGVGDEADALARCPAFDDKRAVAQRGAGGLVQCRQLGRGEVAQLVLRQGQPDVGHEGRVEIAGQARPAQAALAGGLISGGVARLGVGAGRQPVAGDLEAVDGVGGRHRCAVGPDQRPEGVIDNQLRHGDRLAVIGDGLTGGIDDRCALPQRSQFAGGGDDHIPFIRLDRLHLRVAVGQAGQLFQRQRLIVVAERGNGRLIEGVADGGGGDGVVAVKVEVGRLRAQADDEVFGWAGRG